MSAPIEARPIRQSPRSTTGLHVTRDPDWPTHTYHVHGGDDTHWVWYDGKQASCDCADFTWRKGITCRHILAVHEETGRGGSATG